MRKPTSSSWTLLVLTIVTCGMLASANYYSALTRGITAPFSSSSFSSSASAASTPWPGFGRIDFIEYWSAHQLVTQGISPYDIDAMNTVQSQLGHPSPPLMMWNPPWTLTLLKPVLRYDFSSSATIWLWLNITLVIAATLIARSVLKKNIQPTEHNYLLVAAMLSFQPALDSLQIGQLGIFLMFWTTVVCWCMTQKHYFSAGFSSTFLLVKPHLFVFLGVTLLWWIVSNRQYRILVGLVVGTSLLLLITSTLNPLWWTHWKSSLQNASLSSASATHTALQNGVPGVLNWVGTTLTGTMRAYGEPILGSLTNISALLTPSILTICWLVYLIRRRPNINWTTWFPPLVAFSAWLSAFGWSFDFAVAYPLYLSLITNNKNTRDRAIAVSMIAWGFLSLWLQLRILTHLHQLFFVLPGILLAWSISHFWETRAEQPESLQPL